MGASGISPGADFELWLNNNRGRDGDAYTGVQGQSSIKDNTDSLETAANAWVIVFSDKNYTGDSMQIDPQTYLSDLKNVDRLDASGSNQGNWKNQIQSFILYKTKPAFWGQNPTQDELFVPGTGNAVVTEDDNFLGANRFFTGSYSAVNLRSIGYTTNSNAMDGSINALRTGNNAWLVIFDGSDCGGASLKVGPNVKYPLLNNVSRYDQAGNKLGDWKNQIDSFLLYTEMPGFWETPYPRPYIDFEALFNLYPGTINDGSNAKITYVIADATYDIDEPDLVLQAATQSWDGYQAGFDLSILPEDGWTQYHVDMDHQNTGGRNDHASFDLFFDNDGNLNCIQQFEWSSNGAYQVPQQLITIVDDEAALLGAIGALETLGISEEAADTFIKIFDFVTTVFNDISELVYKLTDNGGSYYFLPVICHTVNRICTTVMDGYDLQTYSDPEDSRGAYTFNFDYDAYLSALTQASTSISATTNWAVKDGASGTMSQVMEYQYGGYHYRTWYQEVSFSMELGIMVSCKIDYEIDDNKDDHIILLLGFTIPSTGQTKPALCFAQGTIQFTDQSNDNIKSDTCTGSDAIEAVYSQLAQGILQITIDSSEGGRAYLADIAEANMQAMANCILFGPSS